MIEELIILMNDDSIDRVRAYYKKKNSLKRYYDYQLVSEGEKLNGSYDMVTIPELIFYLQGQSYVI